MALQQTVNLALKDKAPKLHAQLAAAGELTGYLAELARQISSETVSPLQEQRIREKWDRLGPLECAARLRTASVLHREAVMADLLQFPPEGTALSMPD